MRRICAALMVSFLMAGAAAAHAADTQTSGQAVAERLIGKQLFLRGFWGNDDLKFDANGQIETASQTVSFTESGIDVHSVRVDGNTLYIEDQRMALEYLTDEEIRRVQAKTEQEPGATSLNIEGDGTGNFDKALDRVFANDLASLTPSLPQYWQAYAMQHFLPVVAEKQEIAPSRPVARPVEFEVQSFAPAQKSAVHVGGAVKPPTLIRTYNPTFTDLANAQQFTGNVKLYLWFDADGKVSHVSVARPAGLGLDEAAIAAVEKYEFAPATKDGNAVTVDLYLDVSFKTLRPLW